MLIGNFGIHRDSNQPEMDRMYYVHELVRVSIVSNYSSSNKRTVFMYTLKIAYSKGFAYVSTTR